MRGRGLRWRCRSTTGADGTTQPRVQLFLLLWPSLARETAEVEPRGRSGGGGEGGDGAVRRQLTTCPTTESWPSGSVRIVDNIVSATSLPMGTTLEATSGEPSPPFP